MNREEEKQGQSRALEQRRSRGSTAAQMKEGQAGTTMSGRLEKFSKMGVQVYGVPLRKD